MKTVLILLALAIGTAFSGTRFDLIQTGQGKLTHRQAEKLAALPDTLARMGSDAQRAWSETAQLALQQEARGQGFLSANVNLEIQDLDSSHNRASVKATLLWGPVYTFATPRFLLNNSSLALDTAALAIQAGSVFQQDAIALTIQQISEFYMSHGYLQITCLPALDIDTAQHLVRTAFDIRPGKLILFGGMKIEGLHLTRRDIVRGLWNANFTDTVRPQTIQSFNQKLYQTKLFSNVKIIPRPYPTDTSLSLIEVNVRERIPGSVDGLVAYEPVYGASLEGIVRHRNVWGTLNELSFTGKLAQRDQLLQLGYGTPLLFGSDASMDYTLSLEQVSAELADTTASRLLSLSNKGTFTYPIRSWTTSWLTLVTARNSYYYPGGSNRVDYAYSVELGQDFGWKNDATDPTKGWSVSGEIGNGGEIGFDTTYTWISAANRAWIPLWGPFLTAFALDGGRFLNSTTLDGAAKFWQGGGRSVRSYDYHSLRVTSDGALRPRFLRASAELRLNLPWSFQAVWFNDWARLWNEGQPSHLFESTGMPWGYGVGLRYKISLLSLRLDYALGRGTERFAFDLSQAI